MDKKKDAQLKDKNKEDKAEKYEKPTLVKYSKIRGVNSVGGALIT